MQAKEGEIYDGKVTGITTFGAFVKLSTGETGMVHISQVARTYVKDINEFLKEGQDVRVKVIPTRENDKIALSIKQALPPEEGSEAHERQYQKREGQQQRTHQKSSYGGNNSDRRKASSGEPQSFDEMMAKFKQVSDEKQADMKRAQKHSGYGRRGNSNNSGKK